MGQFNINITANGGHGCERRARPGERLYARCQKLDCPDCLAYDFAQMLRQKGFVLVNATFVHWPGTEQEVTDDLITNSRKAGHL
jgi:hypothetical protein